MGTQKKPRSYSFEFFPPRDEEARIRLRDTTRELARLKPKFFSVTFGAAGSTRDGTFEAVQEIVRAGLRAAPHISGICSTKAEIRELLEAGHWLQVALDEQDRVIGLIGGQTHYNGKVWELHPLAVATSARRQGLGRRLVESLAAHAPAARSRFPPMDSNPAEERQAASGGQRTPLRPPSRRSRGGDQTRQHGADRHRA